MIIDAKSCDFEMLNKAVAETTDKEIMIKNCLGERFIGAGISDKRITIDGVPGNALGSYLNGAKIEVFGNVQDAVGDTMNDGEIVVHGSAGDALGYAMRGGSMYIKGDSGYRTGVHMKEYGNKKPVVVIGGVVGSFLGEYQAGGTIVILNLNNKEKPFGNFISTGIHGGAVYVRCENENVFPSNVHCKLVDEKDEVLLKYIKRYSELFDCDFDMLKNSTYYKITAESVSPYKKLYIAN